MYVCLTKLDGVGLGAGADQQRLWQGGAEAERAASGRCAQHGADAHQSTAQQEGMQNTRPGDAPLGVLKHA